MASTQPITADVSAPILAAYRGGQMSEQEKREFEQDVAAGLVQLPAGESLQAAPAAPAAQPSGQAAPPALLDAYFSGQMTPQEQREFAQDVQSGLWTVPANVAISQREGSDVPTAPGEPMREPYFALTRTPSLGEQLVGAGETALTLGTGAIGGTIGMLAGEAKGLAEQILSGEYGTPQAADLVEQAAMRGAQALTYAPRTQAGQAQVQAIGGTLQQLPAVAPLAAETAAISQAARAAQLQRALTRAPGELQPTPAAPTPTMPAPTAPSAVPTAPPSALPAAQLTETARKAAEGRLGATRAQRILAEQAAPDPKTIEAAQRLGIENYLQPDHVSTNQAYRELSQAVKSMPGSEARALEMQGLEKVSQRANDLIEQIGGTRDLSQVNVDIKRRMQSTVGQLEQQADELYTQLRENIPAQSPANAQSVLSFINQRAQDLGGKQNLSSMEKMILAKLSPKEVAGKPRYRYSAETGKQELVPTQPQLKQPTYALLDDVRRDLTAARIKSQGPFKDADAGLIKKLETELKKDQQAAIPENMRATFNAAQNAVRMRKGLEDDMVSLFGKQLDESLVGDLSGAVKKLSSGDVSKFVNLVKAVPEDMRQNLVASGLTAAFDRSARTEQMNFGNYAKWYEGLLQNKRAYTALMANLPGPARKQLSDLYRVSKGVSKATREYITTGRLQAIQEQLRGADSLMARLYGVAKRSGAGLAAEAVTTPFGAPGVGLAAGVASALTKGKPNTMKLADDLIASPEFTAAVRKAGQPGEAQAVKALAKSTLFQRLRNELGKPAELDNPEQWVMQSLHPVQLQAPAEEQR
jgi:hypothetical protein